MTDETIRRAGRDIERAGRDLAFERKAQLSSWALAFERLWPRLWLVLGVIGLFILVSLAGIWPHLGALTHKIVLAAFATALIAALINAARIPWPSREEAIRRIERRSGVAHRPASSYEDTLSAGRTNPETMAIWQAHRRAPVRHAGAAPRRPARAALPTAMIPWRCAPLMLLGVAALLALAGDSATDRIHSAFRFDTRGTIAEARLDAWITPPAYTLRPPMMLADGSKPGAQGVVNTAGVIEAPERSVLIVRSSGATALAAGPRNHARRRPDCRPHAPRTPRGGRAAGHVGRFRNPL